MSKSEMLQRLVPLNQKGRGKHFLPFYLIFLMTILTSIHQAIGRSQSEFYHSPPVLVYTFHLAFMTVFGFTSMHVQVITRFIASASPLIYWYSAHVIIKDTADLTHGQRSSKWRSKFLVGYFLLYFFIGTVLHCNFYPWT